MGTLLAGADKVLTGNPSLIEIKGKFKVRDNSRPQVFSMYAANLNGADFDLSLELASIKSEANQILLDYLDTTTAVMYDTTVILHGGVNDFKDVDASLTRSSETNIRASTASNDPDRRKASMPLLIIAPPQTVLLGEEDEARELDTASVDLISLVNNFREDNPNGRAFVWSTTSNGSEDGVSAPFQSLVTAGGTVKWRNTSR